MANGCASKRPGAGGRAISRGPNALECAALGRSTAADGGHVSAGSPTGAPIPSREFAGLREERAGVAGLDSVRARP
jgi:hypothetical protein